MSEKKLEFGDYVSIEMKRFVGDNEHYIYKVIGTLRSNTWRDVPAVTHEPETGHSGELQEVVNVVCQGVSETRTERYRVADVKFIRTSQVEYTKQEVEARDELIKEMVEGIKKVGEELNKHIASDNPNFLIGNALAGIHKLLTKAQSFNQE